MNSILVAALALMMAIATPLASADDKTEHDQHHPDASKPAPKNPPKAASAAKPGSDQMMKMDTQMKAMRDMHEKMMNAKTPEERNALMSEHMKTMQDGMSMMRGMMGNKSSGGQTMSPQTMQKQMEMMQMMMQMMMDRMGSPAPGK